MNHPPILVIGSTGKTGRRIVQQLLERGHAVKEGSRQSEPPFDWEKPSTWPESLRGVEAAYISYFPDLAVPSAPAAIEELTSCAIKAGVKRLVLLSGRGERAALREYCPRVRPKLYAHPRELVLAEFRRRPLARAGARRRGRAAGRRCARAVCRCRRHRRRRGRSAHPRAPRWSALRAHRASSAHLRRRRR